VTERRAPPPNVVTVAVGTANAGPCAKSKRGAVVFERISEFGGESPRQTLRDGDDRYLIRAACFNAPPLPVSCDGGSDACRKACREICVHAETGALMAALDEAGRAVNRDEWELVHVKTVNGRLVGSGPPSCWQCSKLMLGLRIAGIWLYQKHEISVDLRNVPEAGETEPPPRWVFRTALDFHIETLEHCNLPMHIKTKDLAEAVRMCGGPDLQPIRLEKLR
jgi:hypothetical protein